MLKFNRKLLLYGFIILVLITTTYVFYSKVPIEDKSQSSQIVSEKARYFAEVNGEYKEVTKEEYEKIPKKYFGIVDGELKEIDKEKFESLVSESDKKEKEFLSKKEN